MKKLLVTTMVCLSVSLGACVKDDYTSYQPVVYTSEGLALTALTYDQGKNYIDTLQRYIAAKTDTALYNNADSVVYTWYYESAYTATSFSYSGNTAGLLANKPGKYTVHCQAHYYKGTTDTLLHGAVSYYVMDTTRRFITISGAGLF